MSGLDGTLGSTLIGSVFGTLLFGILTLQTFNYYRLYPNDSVILKILVASLWFFDLGHSICVWHSIYQMTVTFYGQIQHILNPPRSLEISVLFTALIILTVQTFFAGRIRVLSGHWHITIICSLLTTLRFAFSIVLLVTFATSTGFSVLQTKIHWTFTTVSSLGPAVDLITAISLCYFLWEIRTSRAPFTQTRNILDTLILWTIETTVITSFAGIMQLILFLSRKDLAWMAFYMIQSKLFSNSMLASLNNRKRRSSVEEDNILSLPSARSRTHPNVAIHMHRITERDDIGIVAKDDVSGGKGYSV
ncbi:hypothetical protein C8R44DRAFT_684396 [Mycena epipterygia]|nr:hypothetical protein C8R44DRAFT_684396 [Mycena epipterygia]